MRYDNKGQGFNVGIIWVVGISLIMLSLVGLACGAVHDRAEDLVDGEGGETTTTGSLLSTFATDPSVSWDNITMDNAKDFWGVDSGATDNHWVGDNCGGSVSTCIYYQDLTIPTYNDVITASVTGSWSISDNTDLDDMNIYVVLQNPAGDNTYLLTEENTRAVLVADNAAWNDIDNDVTSLITGSGTYILYLQDNSTRAVSPADNYVSIRWDNFQLAVTTYVAGYAENLVDDAGEHVSDNFPLLALVVTVGIIGAVILIFRQVM